MPRTRADLLDSYRSYLALQRDLSGHTVRAYLVDVGDLLSFLGVGQDDAEPVGPALATDRATKRSHLYHPGFRHGYRAADKAAQADLREHGAITYNLENGDEA